MYSLKSEYLEAGNAGVADQTQVSQAVTMERGSPFSLHEELRVALYVAIAGITAGVGIVLKGNLDRIGPVTVIIALVCYPHMHRNQRNHVIMAKAAPSAAAVPRVSGDHE